MQRQWFFLAALILSQTVGRSAVVSRPYLVRNASGEIQWVQSDNYYHLSDAQPGRYAGLQTRQGPGLEAEREAARHAQH